MSITFWSPLVWVPVMLAPTIRLLPDPAASRFTSVLDTMAPVVVRLPTAVMLIASEVLVLALVWLIAPSVNAPSL